MESQTVWSLQVFSMSGWVFLWFCGFPLSPQDVHYGIKKHLGPDLEMSLLHTARLGGVEEWVRKRCNFFIETIKTLVLQAVVNFCVLKTDKVHHLRCFILSEITTTWPHSIQKTLVFLLYLLGETLFSSGFSYH